MDYFGHRPGYARESVGIAAETGRGTHRVFPGFRLQNGRDCRRYGARSRNIETTSSQGAFRRQVIGKVLDEPLANGRA